jgi:hypothetical protein
MSPMGTPACANHAERTSAARCGRCRTDFCDECLAFDVNGAPWCSPCGNGALDESRPRYGRAAAFLAVAWSAVSLLWIVRVVTGYTIPYLLVALVVGYGGSLGVAWNIASPITGAEPARIERRR